MTTLLCIFDGIGEQVHDDPLQLLAVSIDGQMVKLNLARNRYILLGSFILQQFSHLNQQLCQITSRFLCR